MEQEGGPQTSHRPDDRFLIDFQPSVQRWVSFMMVGRGDERQDVIQEALLEAWASRTSIRGGKGSVKPWLRVVTRNVVSRYYRREQVRRTVEFHDPWELEQETASDALPSSVTRTIRNVVADLPELEAMALTLRHVEERQLDDVAELMDVSVSTVKRLLLRARARARRSLQTEGLALLSPQH